jgi:hypothetical protein
VGPVAAVALGVAAAVVAAAEPRTEQEQPGQRVVERPQQERPLAQQVHLEAVEAVPQQMRPRPQRVADAERLRRAHIALRAGLSTRLPTTSERTERRRAVLADCRFWVRPGRN